MEDYEGPGGLSRDVSTTGGLYFRGINVGGLETCRFIRAGGLDSRVNRLGGLSFGGLILSVRPLVVSPRVKLVRLVVSISASLVWWIISLQLISCYAELGNSQY
jgi:hypothetical protein